MRVCERGDCVHAILLAAQFQGAERVLRALLSRISGEIMLPYATECAVDNLKRTTHEPSERVVK